MKKILIPSLLATILFASEQNYIEIGGGVVKSKDNFSTESTKNISSLGSADSENQAFPYLSFFYGYELNETTNIYTGLELGELFLGSSLDTSYGVFDFGLKADMIGEEWKNPFLTGANREKIDTKEYGLYLGYGTQVSEKFETMFRYEFSKKTYDKDEVLNVLKREGDRHILILENLYNINEKVSLLNNLSYEKYDAKGKASSYDEYKIELGYLTKFNDNISLALLGSYGKKDYKALNPELNKKVDGNIYGVFADIRWEQPLNYQNTYISFKTGYEEENTNTDFYDKENTFGVVSIGYKF